MKRRQRQTRQHPRGIDSVLQASGAMRRKVTAQPVVPEIISDGDYDKATPPIWQKLQALGRAVPPSVWESEPDDLSTRIDEVVYGTQGESNGTGTG